MSQKKVDRYKEEKANRQQIMRTEKRKRRAEIVGLLAVLILLVGWFSFAVIHQVRSNGSSEVPATEISTAALESYMSDLNDELNQETEEEVSGEENASADTEADETDQTDPKGTEEIQ